MYRESNSERPKGEFALSAQPAADQTRSIRKELAGLSPFNRHLNSPGHR
jgi:hypothetical protein